MKALTAVIAALLALSAGGKETAPLRFTGEAVVRNVGTNRIAIFLDTDADRKIDHGFLLSSDLPVASDLAIECPEARLEFTDGWARLASGSKLFELYVAGYPEPPVASGDLEARRFIGYALVHSSGDAGCSLERALGGDPGACYRYGDDD